MPPRQPLSAPPLGATEPHARAGLGDAGALVPPPSPPLLLLHRSCRAAEEEEEKAEEEGKRRAAFRGGAPAVFSPARGGSRRERAAPGRLGGDGRLGTLQEPRPGRGAERRVGRSLGGRGERPVACLLPR